MYLFVLILISISFSHADPVMDMIQAGNYPAEKHTVQTKDGYILSVYRIPNLNARRDNQKVILLMHGLTSAAPVFLALGRNISSAYKFADAGFDVWIGNARGNTFSRRHITKHPNDPTFWDFSWHEIGVFDIPATIDYILEQTNKTKLSYVGHSQGVTVFYVMLSELPQYNDKIAIAHLMTTPVLLKYNHPLVPRSMESVNAVAAWLRTNGIYELFSHSSPYIDMFEIASRFCMSQTGRDICRSVVFILFGPSNLYKDDLLAKIINHIPAGSSYKQFIHYVQIAVAHRFQHYDHGIKMNLKIYGTPKPPEYNLTNVRAKVHILQGANDLLTQTENVPLLAKAMGCYPVAISHVPGFNHIDFIFGSNLDKIHKKIFKVSKIFY